MHLKMIEIIKNVLIKIYIHVFQILHPVEKTVVFNSFNGMQYSDNPRAISEKLHELYPQYNIVWLLINNDRVREYVPNYVTIVEYNGKNLRREISKAKAYVTNCELAHEFEKRKGQLFIQTWHGDICFKKMLLELDEKFPVFDNKYTDYCLSGSVFGKERYKTVLDYYGLVINEGSPRNDCLFSYSEEELQEIKKSIGVDCDSRILLFAPTFRDSNKYGLKVYFDVKRVLSLLQDKYKGNWVCLVRAHVGSGIVECDNTIDVSDYPDMARMLLVADFLISDYSSCATDYIIRDKPIILCQFDSQEYEKNDRKLVFDSKEAGFIVADTEEELYKIVEATTAEEYKASNKRVWDYFGMNETGHASEKVVEIITQE